MARSLKHSAAHGGVVVFVNNSTDRTYECAVAALRGADVPHVVIDVAMPAGTAAAGYARLAAFEAALCRVTAQGVLLTTDADTVVHREWVEANARLLESADFVFGHIALDTAEFAILPDVVRKRIRAEERYRDLSLRLVNTLDPISAPPHSHGLSGGASIGCRASAYVEVGGFPPVASSEDVGLAERAFLDDMRVVRCRSVSVTTSCRLAGRAAGGMAETLARWCEDADGRSYLDLEDPASAYLRAWARARLRSCWSAGKGGGDVLRLLGFFADEREFHDHPRFGQAWRWVEHYSPTLRQSRMSFGDIETALPGLQRLVASLVQTNDQGVLPEVAA